MDRPFNHMSGATGKPLGPRTLDIAKHHLHQPLVSPWLGEANQKQKKNNFTEKKQLLTWVLTLYIFKCCWQFQFHCPIFCIKQLEASCLAVGKLLATKGTGVLTNKKQYLFCLTWPKKKLARDLVESLFHAHGGKSSDEIFLLTWHLKHWFKEGHHFSVISSAKKNDAHLKTWIPRPSFAIWLRFAFWLPPVCRSLGHPDVQGGVDPKKIGPHNVSTRKNVRFSQSPWIGSHLTGLERAGWPRTSPW